MCADEVPGGEASRAWQEDYLALRTEGWDRRKAAYIAWAASPADRRWPATQRDLATQVLGLKSDRMIRIWREKDPRIDERVAQLQVEPLFRHRRDVIDALVAVARSASPKANPDRRLFFELTGDLRPAAPSAVAVAMGGQASLDLSGLSDDELEAIASGRVAPSGSGRAAAEAQGS